MKGGGIFIIVAAVIVPALTTVLPDNSDTRAGQNTTGVFCPQLEILHRGYKAPQTEGHILLKQENTADPAPVSEDSNSNATDSVSNETCVVSKHSDGKQYNWWQSLLQNGGKPGTLMELQRKQNTSDPEKYQLPCRRPVGLLDGEFDSYFAYQYENSDFKTFYRKEEVNRRFEDTPNMYLEIFGTFVWIPPAELNDTVGYRVKYSVDDTGFWVDVKDEDCFFDTEDGQPSLNCYPLLSCFCDSSELECISPVSGIDQNLLASLVGGG